jgi:hypothetical protein
VEISDTAREAQKITAWADAVRALPDVREDVMARVAELLSGDSLLGMQACRGAAAALMGGVA